MLKPDMDDKTFQELASLFFTTRQIIRQQLPGERPDPNAWLRSETLRFVAQSRNPTMLDIARHLRVRAPSATSLVAKLVSLGFLSRHGETSDKRVVHVLLTARGKRELRDYAKRSARIMRTVFSKLPPRDVREFARILRQLQQAHQY